MDKNSEKPVKLVLNAKQLAVAIGYEYSTVRQYASKHPELLPPRCKLPVRKLLWEVEAVQDWLRSHRDTEVRAIDD
jgi:predicted DNA-binding transcriptional regulator AlpA